MTASGSSRKDPTGPTASSSDKALRIASWNVRTMYETGKSRQVAMEMKRYRLHILGVSETHWIQSGEKRLSSGELVLFSGRQDGHHSGGVGIILNRIAQKALRGWEPQGERIIMASFTTRNRNINMNILQIYAPTNDASDEDKEEFYSMLQGVTDKLPKKDINIVMGDANAKVGQDNKGYEITMGRNGLGQMNDNGERFANFCSFNSLVIGGTVFPNKRIHKATWISPDGLTENQIDHFCISRRFRRSLEDLKVRRGADVGSDHHLLLAKVRLHLKQYSKRTETNRRYQVSMLEGGRKEEFQLQLRNRFEVLADLREDQDVEEQWLGLKDAIISTCEEVLGVKQTEHKEWISQETLQLIEKRRGLKAEVMGSRTRASKLEAQAQYKTAAREVKTSVKKDKERYISELARNAEEAAAGGHMRTLYQTTRTLAGKYGKPEIPVKDERGNPIFGREAQSQRWVEHFNRLLNRPSPSNPPDILPARNDLPIQDDPPSKCEIVQAINKIKRGKAAGPDQIPPEALKADVEGTADALHPLFVRIWREECFPKDWKDGHLVKLPKKGDLSNCNNYRGITLLSIPGKIFNRIILERIKSAADPRLREEQAGFRKNRSTTDQIATLRILVEQSLEWNSQLVINFLDYEKAFDSLDRDTLWKILRHYGIPQKLVNLIKTMYEDTSCRVIHAGQLTDSFNIRTGVRQGCLLSPFLFILAIDWLMKETTQGRRNGIQWTPWTKLDDLDFADDIALLSHTQQHMQAKTTAISDLSESIGLRIHPEKSKVLRIGSQQAEPIKVRGQPLEDVDSFCYLGSKIDTEGGTGAEVKARVGKAQATFTSLTKIWRTKDISLKTKVRIFNSNVKAVLMYGCEAWNASQTCVKRIQVFINKCLRRILRIKWTDKIPNEEVWRRTGQVPVGIEIGRRRWRWIGHTLRKDGNSITKRALEWNPQGRRTRGRPRGTWRRVVERDTERGGKTWSQVKKLAQDRERWRAFVCGLYPDPG